MHSNILWPASTGLKFEDLAIRQHQSVICQLVILRLIFKRLHMKTPNYYAVSSPNLIEMRSHYALKIILLCTHKMGKQIYLNAHCNDECRLLTRFRTSWLADLTLRSRNTPAGASAGCCSCQQCNCHETSNINIVFVFFFLRDIRCKCLIIYSISPSYSFSFTFSSSFFHVLCVCPHFVAKLHPAVSCAR